MWENKPDARSLPLQAAKFVIMHLLTIKLMHKYFRSVSMPNAFLSAGDADVVSLRK